MSILLFIKKRRLLYFSILCTILLSYNAFPNMHWNKDFAFVNYVQNGNRLYLKFIFFSYEFGPNKEHAYLQWCDFEYSTDGENYKTLAKCEVEDQAYSDLTWVLMTNKLPGAQIKFLDCQIPEDNSIWDESKNMWVAVKTKLYPRLTLMWNVPDKVVITDIRIIGMWRVVGLYCPDYFNQIYNFSMLSLSRAMKLNVNTDLKQTIINEQGIAQPKQISKKVYKEANHM